MATGALAACSATTDGLRSAQFNAAPVKQAAAPPTKDSSYKVGKPYQVAGRWYTPQEDPAYDEVGAASWYGSDFHGRQTANGETYDMHGLTAAHPTLPLPSYARVTNLENDRSVVVRINDRGPFTQGRVIDLSKQTARLLEFKQNGTAQVRVQYVGPASPQGDDGWLTTTVRENGETVEPSRVAESEPAASPQPAISASGQPEETAFALVSGFAPRVEGNIVAEAFRHFD